MDHGSTARGYTYVRLHDRRGRTRSSVMELVASPSLVRPNARGHTKKMLLPFLEKIMPLLGPLKFGASESHEIQIMYASNSSIYSILYKRYTLLKNTLMPSLQTSQNIWKHCDTKLTACGLNLGQGHCSKLPFGTPDIRLWCFGLLNIIRKHRDERICWLEALKSKNTSSKNM